MKEVGGYRLGERLGGGASGTVWRAERVGPTASSWVGPVALKLLSEPSSTAATEQLRREAAVLAELDHPHVVRLLEVVDHDGGPALVMGLAQGGSLADLQAERGRLSPGEAVAVLAPVADALASAHRKGLVHGDVKPSNVLLTSDGEPLLADFGAAGRWNGDVAGRSWSSSEDFQPVIGTEPYLDPAVRDGAAPRPGSDLYALAVTGHELLTGHLPDTPGGRRLQDDRSIPAGLAAVLEAALTRTRDDRSPDLSHFAAELRAAVPAGSIVVPGPSLAITGLGRGAEEGRHRVADDDAHRTRLFGPRPPEPVPRASRRRWRVPAVALLLLVAAGLGVAFRVRTPGSHATASRSPHRRRAGPACPTFPPVGPGTDVQLSGDLNGDGCPVPVAWDGQVMQVRLRPTDPEPAHFRFDRRGQLLLGDWDCDGKATPALYLSSAGEVVYYNRFANPHEAPGVEERGMNVAAGGTARTVTNADGCDEVRVSPAPS